MRRCILRSGLESWWIHQQSLSDLDVSPSAAVLLVISVLPRTGVGAAIRLAQRLFSKQTVQRQLHQTMIARLTAMKRVLDLDKVGLCLEHSLAVAVFAETSLLARCPHPKSAQPYSKEAPAQNECAEKPSQAGPQVTAASLATGWDCGYQMRDTCHVGNGRHLPLPTGMFLGGLERGDAAQNYARETLVQGHSELHRGTLLLAGPLAKAAFLATDWGCGCQKLETCRLGNCRSNQLLAGDASQAYALDNLEPN